MTKFNNQARWLEIGGKKEYFKSKKEVLYALRFENEKKQGKIKDWEYERDTFVFPGQVRGPVNYKPDFCITELDGTLTYHEVKGYMDPRSKSKLKKFKKYYPSLKICVNGKPYEIVQKIKRQLVRPKQDGVIPSL